MSTFFSKKVDLRSRSAMVDFLTKHERYFTMNAWNRLTSYANVVKVPRLRLPDDCNDMAYVLAYNTDNDWGTYLRQALNDFTEKTGYKACFNGRSNGYLVLREKDSTASIDGDLDFDDFGINELRERVRLVQSFDTLCDDIRDAFIRFCRTYEAKTVQRTVIEPVETIVPKPGMDPLVDDMDPSESTIGPVALRVVPKDDMAILRKYLSGQTHVVLMPEGVSDDPSVMARLTSLNGREVPYHFMGTADVAVDLIEDDNAVCLRSMLKKLQGSEPDA